VTPIYVAYYTANTPYADEASELVKTLDAFGLEHDVVAVPALGTWAENCSQKPRVIRDAMLRHEGRPIVYLDSDARVRQRPEMFDRMPRDVDLAVHYLDGNELLSGTLYFGATAGGWKLVSEWTKVCREQPSAWDQLSLQNIVDARECEFKIHYLPEGYTYIFDRNTLAPDQQVIVHGQASRRFRGIVGG
jgi:hypothetical protein